MKHVCLICGKRIPGAYREAHNRFHAKKLKTSDADDFCKFYNFNGKDNDKDKLAKRMIRL